MKTALWWMRKEWQAEASLASGHTTHFFKALNRYYFDYTEYLDKTYCAILSSYTRAARKLYVSLKQCCLGFFVCVDFKQVRCPWDKNSIGDIGHKVCVCVSTQSTCWCVGMCLNSVLYTNCSLSHSFIMAAHF